MKTSPKSSASDDSRKTVPLPFIPHQWKKLPTPDFCVSGSAGKIYRVPLILENPAGWDLKSHPVTNGIPIPEGALRDPNFCRLLSATGEALPLQTQALAYWPDGSVKWLLLDFQIQAHSTVDLVLEYGADFGPGVSVREPVRVETSLDGVEVSSGNVRFVIHRGAFFILKELSLENSQTTTLLSGIEAVFRARSGDGSCDGLYTARIADIQVEEKGPLRAVVRLSGWHERNDERKSMPFVIRLTVWAGVAGLGIQHTFIVSDDPMSTFFSGIGLRLLLNSDSTFQETQDGLALISRDEKVFVGTLVRDRQYLLPKQNRFDPKSRALGVYLWPDDGEEMDLRPALVRRPPDFEEWVQKYPDAFAHIEGGALNQKEAEDAFSMKTPCPSMGNMRGRSGMGMAKTHEVFIGIANDAKACEALLRPFDKPLFAAAPPSYYSMTRALGDFHPYDPENFPEIEAAMDRHLTWVWRHQNEWFKWHGIFDYGDFFTNYDTERGEWWKYDGGRWGWLNGEVNAEQGLFLQYLRTGERRWLDFAEAAARHRVDCDQLHYHDKSPELIGGMHRHYMTEHWSGVIDGGHTWVDGAVNLYYFFGFRRGLECAIEGAEFAIRYCLPLALHHAETTRETNNGLRCLARVYEATRDEKYREAADAIARAYSCSFGKDGVYAPLEEALQMLQREFAGSPWMSLPQICNYNWHGHCGYQYNGYLAPAVRYWATLGRTSTGIELQRRFDQYVPAMDLGNEGQFYGEMYLETKDPRYLLPIVRGLPGTIQVPVPLDGKGTEPNSYIYARIDYLYGVPYVMAALYAARDKLESFLPKPSSMLPGYRAPVRDDTENAHYKCVDLSQIANRDPRWNPFGRPLEKEDALALPELKPGQIGFQPYKGTQCLKEKYLPVAPHHVYPSSASTITPNQNAIAGLPFGGTVKYGGVPFRLLNPDANSGQSVIVLEANQSVTIPIGQQGRALHFLGHVHGAKNSQQISQYAPLPLGYYEIAYADGTISKVELLNGNHFDSFFNHAYASDVTHAANFDWLHVFANSTDDRMHLNQMRLPLDSKPVRSVTFRSGDENWGLLLAAVTLEIHSNEDAPQWKEGSDIVWEDRPGWSDIKLRMQPDDRGMRLMAPCRIKMPLADGWHEVELTVSGDLNPYAAPRLRVECSSSQLLSDYCLAGGGLPEKITFLAKAEAGTLALDLIPAPNYATGKLAALNKRYGDWRSPEGNFTRVEAVRIRSVHASEISPPSPANICYGWLRPGATGEASRGGLVVDHEDTNDLTPTSNKWSAGGFRVDVPAGRYQVFLYHTTYANAGALSVDVIANKIPVFSGSVDYETIEFAVDAACGYIQLEWHQPHVNQRVPRYAIRAITVEKME